MAGEGSGSDSEPQLNANPFDTAEGNAESKGWAQKVAFADAEERQDAKKGSSSSDLDKEKTHSDDDSLHLIDTIKSAKDSAKRKLHLETLKAKGPAKFFNPTSVQVHVKWKDDDNRPSKTESGRSGTTARERAFLWRSRDNRKSRNSIAIPTSVITSPSAPLRARFTFGIGEISHGIFKMCTSFPYWEMAFWGGFSYTVGSILFVMDGSWAYIEEAHPGRQPESVGTYGGPLSFFIGALFYQLGATMAYLEAVNDGSFQGSAMRRLLDGHEEDQKAMLDHKIHSFFGHFIPTKKEKKDAEKAHDSVDPEAGWKTKNRHERPGSLYPLGKNPGPRRGGIDFGEAEEGSTTMYMTWRWYPSWYCFRHHHIFEIGYLACSIQLLGATLYGVTGIVVLPWILPTLAHWQKEAAFWIIQIIASVCFLTASILFTLETQTKWYKPEPTILGWWIGFWAGVGSVGFLLIGIFGALEYDYEWGALQADIGTIWGSAAYLISSLLQWYEAVNKNPVEDIFDDPDEMKSH